ncbi:MAG: aminoacyl-tRNA hydrolase [Rubripirellula sp.]|nr:aminoacyl-tRNA hydrolase [Rubripirellula sp.]
MKLVVGLGNPGRKYEQTRHNVGFVAVEKVAALAGATPSKTRFQGEFAEASVGGKLLMLWPQTYMNASGRSVREACDFYKISAENVVVVCDDMNLASGRLRFRGSGSAGGQNGLADVIRLLGTDQVARLRIGIGRPPTEWNPADYVLGKFSKGEQAEMEFATEQAAKAVMDWSLHGPDYVMNHYNGQSKSSGE